MCKDLRHSRGDMLTFLGFACLTCLPARQAVVREVFHGPEERATGAILRLLYLKKID
jgi:hypothetical protein